MAGCALEVRQESGTDSVYGGRNGCDATLTFPKAGRHSLLVNADDRAGAVYEESFTVSVGPAILSVEPETPYPGEGVILTVAGLPLDVDSPSAEGLLATLGRGNGTLAGRLDGTFTGTIRLGTQSGSSARVELEPPPLPDPSTFPESLEGGRWYRIDGGPFPPHNLDLVQLRAGDGDSALPLLWPLDRESLAFYVPRWAQGLGFSVTLWSAQLGPQTLSVAIPVSEVPPSPVFGELVTVDPNLGRDAVAAAFETLNAIDGPATLRFAAPGTVEIGADPLPSLTGGPHLVDTDHHRVVLRGDRESDVDGRIIDGLIIDGDVEVRGLEIAGFGGSAVLIAGGPVTLRSVDLNNCDAHGIDATSAAPGTRLVIEDSVLRLNGGTGLELAGSDVEGTLRGVLARSNGVAGFSARAGASLVADDSAAFGQSGPGFYGEQLELTCDSCISAGNAGDGFELSNHRTVVLRNTRADYNGGSGAAASSGTATYVANSNASFNGAFGYELANAFDSVIDAAASANAEGGFVVSSQDATVERAEARYNHGAGITFHDSNAELGASLLQHNGSGGLVVSGDGSRVTGASNQVLQNRTSGIVISDAGDRYEGSGDRLAENEHSGVFVRGELVATLSTYEDNQISGVQVAGGSAALSDMTLQSNWSVGLAIDSGGSATVEATEALGNRFTGYLAGDLGSRLEISGGQVLGSGPYGVWLRGGATGLVTGTRVDGYGNALWLTGGAGLDVEDAILTGGDDGVVVEGSTLTLSNTTIGRNDRADVVGLSANGRAPSITIDGEPLDPPLRYEPIFPGDRARFGNDPNRFFELLTLAEDTFAGSDDENAAPALVALGYALFPESYRLAERLAELERPTNPERWRELAIEAEALHDGDQPPPMSTGRYELPLAPGPDGLLVVQGPRGSESHRGPTQRFAIDLSPAGPTGELLWPDEAPAQLTSYRCWGAAVLAAAPGVVERISTGAPDNLPGTASVGPGNYIVIRHFAEGAEAGTSGALLREVTEYAHLQEGSTLVNEGDLVLRGDRIASCGSSGNTTRPQLEFVVRRRHRGPSREVRFFDFELGTPGEPPLVWRATGARSPQAGDRLRPITSIQ